MGISLCRTNPSPLPLLTSPYHLCDMSREVAPHSEGDFVSEPAYRMKKKPERTAPRTRGNADGEESAADQYRAKITRKIRGDAALRASDPPRRITNQEQVGSRRLAASMDPLDSAAAAAAFEFEERLKNKMDKCKSKSNTLLNHAADVKMEVEAHSSKSTVQRRHDQFEARIQSKLNANKNNTPVSRPVSSSGVEASLKLAAYNENIRRHKGLSSSPPRVVASSRIDTFDERLRQKLNGEVVCEGKVPDSIQTKRKEDPEDHGTTLSTRQKGKDVVVLEDKKNGLEKSKGRGKRNSLSMISKVKGYRNLDGDVLDEESSRKEFNERMIRRNLRVGLGRAMSNRVIMDSLDNANKNHGEDIPATVTKEREVEHDIRASKGLSSDMYRAIMRSCSSSNLIPGSWECKRCTLVNEPVGLDEGTHCKVCFEPKALSREPSLNMKRLTLAPKDDLLVDSWSELEEVLDKVSSGVLFHCLSRPFIAFLMCHLLPLTNNQSFIRL